MERQSRERGGGITSKAKRKSVFTYVPHNRALAMDTHDDDGRMTDEQSQTIAAFLFFFLSLSLSTVYMYICNTSCVHPFVFLLLTSTDSIASSSFSLFPFACVLDYLGWRARGFERVRSGEPRDSSPFPAFVFFVVVVFLFFCLCVFFPPVTVELNTGQFPAVDVFGVLSIYGNGTLYSLILFPVQVL